MMSPMGDNLVRLMTSWLETRDLSVKIWTNEIGAMGLDDDDNIQETLARGTK